LHLEGVESVQAIPPHLSGTRLGGLVPRHHSFGIISGALTTCGTVGSI
jgi:hypothetical protein